MEKCFNSTPALVRLVAGLAVPPDLALLLTRAIDAEPALLVREGGVIAPGSDTELDDLRRLASDRRTFLLELESRQRDRTGTPTLRVKFNCGQGFYTQVSPGAAQPS